jgi:hypothetical protein
MRFAMSAEDPMNRWEMLESRVEAPGDPTVPYWPEDAPSDTTPGARTEPDRPRWVLLLGADSDPDADE